MFFSWFRFNPVPASSLIAQVLTYYNYFSSLCLHLNCQSFLTEKEKSEFLCRSKCAWRCWVSNFPMKNPRSACLDCDMCVATDRKRKEPRANRAESKRIQSDLKIQRTFYCMPLVPSRSTRGALSRNIPTRR